MGLESLQTLIGCHSDVPLLVKGTPVAGPREVDIRCFSDVSGALSIAGGVPSALRLENEDSAR